MCGSEWGGDGFSPSHRVRSPRSPPRLDTATSISLCSPEGREGGGEAAVASSCSGLPTSLACLLLRGGRNGIQQRYSRFLLVNLEIERTFVYNFVHLSIGKCHPLRPPKTRTIILVSSSFLLDATTAISPRCLFGRRRRFRTEKRPPPSPSLRTHGSHISFLTPLPPVRKGKRGGRGKKEESGHIFADASSPPFFGGLFLRLKPRDIHFQWLSHQRKVEFDKVPSSLHKSWRLFPS